MEGHPRNAKEAERRGDDPRSIKESLQIWWYAFPSSFKSLTSDYISALITTLFLLGSALGSFVATVIYWFKHETGFFMAVRFLIASFCHFNLITLGLVYFVWTILLPYFVYKVIYNKIYKWQCDREREIGLGKTFLEGRYWLFSILASLCVAPFAALSFVLILTPINLVHLIHPFYFSEESTISIKWLKTLISLF